MHRKIIEILLFSLICEQKNASPDSNNFTTLCKIKIVNEMLKHYNRNACIAAIYKCYAFITSG